MKGIVFANQEKYLTTLRNKPDALIAEMEEFALENQVPILNWNAAELLEMLVRNSKPKRVLEIGMAIGISTLRALTQAEPLVAKKLSRIWLVARGRLLVQQLAEVMERLF